MPNDNLDNYAFIDGQNLTLGIKELGWKIDYKKLRIYLKDKYNVKKAYYFIGYMPENTDVYNKLQSVGFVLIFKDTFRQKDGNVKGNCDAELVLQTMIDLNEYNKAIIISGDGDFSCLIKYLSKKEKLRIVLSPNKSKTSWLLRKVAKGNFNSFDYLKDKLEYIKV